MIAYSTNEVSRSTLADQIYEHILGDILSGKISAGSKLLTSHLAKRFGTSLAPVREAISRLTEEGLIETKPFVGSVLKEQTWNDLEEIFLMRQVLEVHAAKLIISQKLPKFDAKHPVRIAFENLITATKTKNIQQIIGADVEFHREICKLAKSPLTLEVWTTIMKRYRGARLIFERHHPDSMKQIIENHQMLIDALESGNVKKAETEFCLHLSSAIEYLRLKVIEG